MALDLSTLLFTENEPILIEAQERILKSDINHTWDHFTQLFSDLRKGQLFNRDQIKNFKADSLKMHQGTIEYIDEFKKDFQVEEFDR